MRLKEKHVWFLAFTAVYAALAGFVFWGTWSPDFAPVMPDCPTQYSPHWFTEWWNNWRLCGKFVPGDLKIFLGSPYYWQELQYAIAVYCAALGMMYFLRGRGLSRLASYGGGLLLAFSGYWFSLFSAGHLGWFQWMTYGVFAFGLADRAVIKNKLRHWLLLGATVAWGSFYQADLWLLFTVFTAVYFIYACARERKFPAMRGVAIAAVAFFLIGAPSFYNALFKDLAGRDKQIEEGQTIAGEVKDEAEKRWIFVTNWSLPPNETAEFFVPRINGDTSCMLTLSLGAQKRTGVKQYTGALGRPKDAAQGNYRQHSLYVGWVTCLLALVGAVLGWRKCLFFALAAMVFWLFSMGRYCEMVYRLVYMLPFGDYLRAPVKWHHLTEFCLCVLAAFGVEELFVRFAKTASSRIWTMVVLGAIILFGACDLARVNKVYCAGVDMREARKQNCSQQMTFLRRSDFNNPQIAQMVRDRKVIPLANPNSEVYMVGVLQPWDDKPPATPPMSLPGFLGVVSIISSLMCVLLSTGVFGRVFRR